MREEIKKLRVVIKTMTSNNEKLMWMTLILLFVGFFFLNTLIILN